MTEDEKRSARRRIEHLGREYVHPHPWSGRRHPMEDGFYEWRYALDRLRRADEVIEFLDRSDRDPYTTIVTIDQTLDDAHEGLIRAKSELQAAGFLAILDDHIDTIMRGLDPAGLPEEEADVLEMLGFRHLAATVRDETDVVGEEWRNGSSKALAIVGEYRQSPASSSLDSAIHHVHEHRHARREAARREQEAESAGQPTTDMPEPRKSRRWWKGLGQIIEGASLATIDAGLAIGALKFPVSPDTRTYGSVISVGAGFGKIMSGVGDLWGE
ncbi:MAG: hypothetical protein ACYDH6_23495 [Acidimicrobiales bacterium]